MGVEMGVPFSLSGPFISPEELASSLGSSAPWESPGFPGLPASQRSQWLFLLELV